MTRSGATYNWAFGLTPAQAETAKDIRQQHNNLGMKRHSMASEGWTLYRMPTTGEARYVELRHYLTGGHRVARWVIERDGTISAMNELGDLKELVDQT